MIGITIGIIFVSLLAIGTVWTGYKHLNSVWIAGPLYWIVRDFKTSKYPISVGFMRQTSSPWKTGCGLQIQTRKYSYQIGVCRKSTYMDDQSGLLFAVKGRILETPITEIGEWK